MEQERKREEFLACQGHALVIGGPGSGKTTIALQKALIRINQGLLPGQSVLFVSFSRAAVGRIIETSKLHIKAGQERMLDIQTFHSFFWKILSSHAYLLGSPKPLRIMLPQEEQIHFGKIKKKDRNIKNPEWGKWLQERERLFREEGLIAFDLFADNALALVQRSNHIKRLIAQKHPLIIIDEAQDTNEKAWLFIEQLAPHAQLVCLADLEQQIFDHLEGIGPERIDAIKRSLTPLELDLAGQNHRSPNTEIALFGHDILHGVVKGGVYKGVSAFPYNPRPPAFNLTKTLRMALGALHRQIKKETGKWGRSVAILTSSGNAAAKVSAALLASEKAVKHKLLFDENEALLSAKICAFLLEPKSEDTLHADLATAIELVRDVKRAAGVAAADQMQKWADKVKAGKIPTAGFVKALESIIQSLIANPFCGNPGKDWIEIKKLLRGTGNADLQSVAKYLDYVVGFNRGKLISSGLTTVWERDGAYTCAREVLDTALTQDQILSGIDDPNGLQVMTIHKSKGKQFDGVIILREGINLGHGYVSSLVWREDVAPYRRSRKILRVAVTRAINHTMILNPAFPDCPILTPYKL